MGISESHQHFAFKVTPKPGGGFVSTSDNPALVFEGATEEEVQQKAIEKIGELAGPEMAALLRDAGKPGAASEKRVAVTVNKKTTFSLRSGKPGDAGRELLKIESGPQSEGGLSPLAKAALVVAALLLLLWFGLHR